MSFFRKRTVLDSARTHSIRAVRYRDRSGQLAGLGSVRRAPKGRGQTKDSAGSIESSLARLPAHLQKLINSIG